MDLNEFRSVMSDSGIDVWTWIDMAISVASADHEIELRNRRDGIVQKLFASPCENCVKRNESDQQNHQGIQPDKNVEHDDEHRKILQIKNLLDDHSQNEKSMIELLQRLLDMNTTFTTLKETEIGKHVTKLRKHSSNEVRRLVKVLVRKWRDTVDEWVRQNTPIEEEATEFNDQASYLFAKDDARIHNSVKDVSCHSTPPKRKAKDNGIILNDEDYQESQYAKKQRRPQPQVMDIPKFKNSIVPNNGGSVPIKY
ncbi:probable mediator of RNA polymerase II transcription subunit 26c isoform X2 [Salvia miltiorrhiza]|nr:probable mediator of RNA polymerase II transcription subunit 26c isoform X2 [Salvia miltiorrhiza]